MAHSLNKVTLIGNLGKDPEVRSFNNGGKVVNFSLATSESWKDKNTGEWRDKTEWSKVAVFNEHLAKTAEQSLRKGSKVYLEGKLQTRKYQDQSGRDVYTTEVVLQGFDCKLILLDPKQQRSADDEYGAGGARDYGGGSGGKAKGGDVFGSEFDEDVPF